MPNLSAQNPTRTIRFSQEDLKAVEEFLDRNSIFDFSTLVRIAVQEFIKNPCLELTPVSQKSRTSLGKGAAHGV